MVMFFNWMLERWGSDCLKVVIEGTRVGLFMSLVCKASLRGMLAARCICLVTKHISISSDRILF